MEISLINKTNDATTVIDFDFAIKQTSNATARFIRSFSYFTDTDDTTITNAAAAVTSATIRDCFNSPLNDLIIANDSNKPLVTTTLSSSSSIPTTESFDYYYLNELLKEKFNDATVIISVIILVLINIIVIFGNILVILSVFVSTKLRTVTNFFIVSLAVADFLVGIAVLPYSLTFEILDTWIFGEVWCQGWLVIDVWMCTASILNLCAISVDRYMAVTRPVRYRSLMTAKRAKFIIAGVWIISFIICFPPLLVGKQESFSRSTLRTTTTATAATTINSMASITTVPATTIKTMDANNNHNNNFDVLTYRIPRKPLLTSSSSSSSSSSLSSLYSSKTSSKDDDDDNIDDENEENEDGSLVGYSRHIDNPQVSSTIIMPDVDISLSNKREIPATLINKKLVTTTGDDNDTDNVININSQDDNSYGDVDKNNAKPNYIVNESSSSSSSSSKSSPYYRQCRPQPVQCALFRDKSYVIYSAFGSFFIPMFVMIFFYWRIYLVAIRTSRALKRGYRITKTSREENQERLTLRIHRGYAVEENPMVQEKRPSIDQQQHDTPQGSKKSLADSQQHCRSSWATFHRSSNLTETALTSTTDNQSMTQSGTNKLLNVPPANTTTTTTTIATNVLQRNCRRNSSGYQSNMSLPFVHSASSSREGSARSSKTNLPVRPSKRTSKYQAKRFHAETKAAKTVGIIVGGFIVCWLPFFTVYLTRAFCEDCIPELLFSIFFWLGYCNSMINPCIYGLFSRDFRRAFKNIICRCRLREETSVSSLIRQIHMPTFFEDMPEEMARHESQDY